MAQKKRRGSEDRPPSRALRAAIRFRIVSLCSQRMTSSREFAEREGMGYALASYYFGKLEKEGYLRVVKIELVRGLPRYYYVALRQALLIDEDFARLAPEEKFGITESTLREFLLHYKSARKAKTLWTRGGRNLSCADFDLDDEGWLDLMTALLCVFKSAFDTEIRSSIRLRRSGEQAVPITIALAGFESPALGPDIDGKEFFESFFMRSKSALVSGTLDARIDSHLTWAPLVLDEEGWSELAEDLQWLRDRAAEIKAQAAERLRRSGAAPIHTTFAAAGFEGPPGASMPSAATA